MNQPTTTKPPLYFGWYVLAATFFIDLVVTGSRSSFGIFVLPMSEEFGWSRFTISIVAGMGAIIGGVTQPFIGYIFDQIAGRKVIVLSLVIVGLTTVALSLTFHILFLMFMFGFVFATAAGGARLSRGALLARWFIRKRATVVSIAAAGSSTGSLLLVPMAMYLLQATNWRVSWAAPGLVMLVLAVPMAYFFIRDDQGQWDFAPTAILSLHLQEGPTAALLKGGGAPWRWTSGLSLSDPGPSGKSAAPTSFVGLPP